MARGLDALGLLRKDHEHAEQLFRRFERAPEDEDRSEVIDAACAALTQHADLEEQFFYPIVLEMTGADELLEEARIEHGAVRRMIDELASDTSRGARRSALFRVLMEYVRHHVREEEERIFPLVQRTGVDLEAFGAELAERKGSSPAAGHSGGKGPARAQQDRRAVREERASADAMTASGETQERGSRRRAAQSRSPGQRANGNGDDTAAHRDPGRDENVAYKEAHKDALSRTTLRAKWINSAQEHEDRPGQSLATRSHEVIRRWAEERRAAPATTPGGDPQRPRVLRFNFPGYDNKLQEISWDAWFGTFDERDLVFLFQEHMKAGNPSNFFKFDSPEREHE
jgi:hemerythrin superfamily protein